MPHTGPVKRRNADQTKARILAVAFDLFSEHGYGQTGTRDIASQAGIASSLLARHFGSKANLFEQALIYGIHHNSLFVEEKANFGEQMAKLVVSKSNPKLIAMFALAIADPDSRTIAERVSRDHVVEPLAKWLGSPNARARALNMLSLLHGFIIQSCYLSSDRIPAASVTWLGQALQDIVDNR